MKIEILIQAISFLLDQKGSALDKLSLLKLIFSADKYHMMKYARSITNDSYILLALITSQVEKKKRFYELPNPSLLESLIITSGNDMDILSKESCIDLNQPIFLTKEELPSKVDGNTEFIEVQIEQNLKDKIMRSVKKSSMVRDETKEQICHQK